MATGNRSLRALGVSMAVALAGGVMFGSAALAQDDSGEQVIQGDLGGELCTPANYGNGDIQIPENLSDILIGFAQSERENNPFRSTETDSMESEAFNRGYQLIVTNAQTDLSKEISDIKGMVDRGVGALIISPLNSTGLEEALLYARDNAVPLMTVDRFLTEDTHCDTFIGWVGSDFDDQGYRAGLAMIRESGGEGNLGILLGAPGVNVTDDRNAGFKRALEENENNINLVTEQTGNYVRAEGQQVTEQWLLEHPEIDLIYAHNDEMALGAVAALRAAGKQPGDVKIITIDGTKGAVEGILTGWVSGVIESNPRFGPSAFDALEAFYYGDGVPQKAILSDKEYTRDNAEAELPNAY